MKIWKDYPKHSLYEVSSDGEIRNKKSKIIRKYRIDNKGYYRVNINIAGKHTTLHVHQIVADTFFAHDSEKTHINHIDNNPKNNCILNLERCTHTENMSYSAKQGRKGKGTLYTAEQIFSIKYTYAHLSSYAAEQLTGVKHCTILRVRSGQQWAHI